MTMPFPVHTPRVNNNDDEVRLVGLWVSPGEFVKAGTPLADIETAKATVTIEAEKDGFVLELLGAAGAMVKVGDVLVWMGKQCQRAGPTIQPLACSGGEEEADLAGGHASKAARA